jgi:hypothetical protein
MANLLVFWGGQQHGYDAFRLNPADDAMNVRCPALVFQGGDDSRVTNDQARGLFDHLAGPKQFELFDKSGHCAFLGDAPARWKTAITGFLARYANLNPLPTASGPQ